MQEKILLFFQGFSTPFLDKIGELVSLCGSEILLLGAAMVIYWCLDKKKASVVGISILTSFFFCSLIKATIKAPRPFQKLDSIKARNIESATGYSFPSGHSTSSASFYSSMAFCFRKKWLSAICAVMIVLVGISRMYLGVHWPLDVAAGIILGITVTLLLNKTYTEIFSDDELTKKVCRITAPIAGAACLAMSGLVTLNLIDPVGFGDFSVVPAVLGGSTAGVLLEKTKVNFSVEGSLRNKFFRILFGALSALAVKEGLKLVFPDNCFFDAIRYSLIGFTAFGLYPLIGVKTGLFKKEEREHE